MQIHRHAAMVLFLISLPMSAVYGGEPRDAPVDMFDAKAAETVTWTTFSEKDGTKLEDVWTITPELIVCKGTPLGYLRTEQDFTNFVLRLEWRWPKNQPGNGGVLIRTTGDDKIWPNCLEAQINAGDAGDFWGLDGYQLTGPNERMKMLESEKFGRLTNLKKTESAEREPGEWNEYEISARGGKVTLKINGQTVNETEDCDVVPGKICLTAEGSEIHFRNVRIIVLDK